jgi:hypothetical protein
MGTHNARAVATKAGVEVGVDSRDDAGNGLAVDVDFDILTADFESSLLGSNMVNLPVKFQMPSVLASQKHFAWRTLAHKFAALKNGHAIAKRVHLILSM